MKSTQGGNALFLILIAVALFAALSYAVTQSGRGSGSISKEQAAITASQLVTSINAVKQAAMRMILGGMPMADIRCTHTGNTTDCGSGSANPSGNDICTSGTDCLFAPEGGGATVPTIPISMLDQGSGTFPTNRYAGPTTWNGFFIDGFNTDPDTSIAGMGTNTEDHVFWVFFLREEICAAINRGLGITGIPAPTTWTPEMDATPGQETACIDLSGDGLGYTYYQVLAVQ